MISRKMPKQAPPQMAMYTVPCSTISSMSVCTAKKGRAHSRPAAVKTSRLSTARNTPFSAVRLARSNSRSPRDRESRAFTPTPVPTATEIIRFWKGKARDTADRAFSLIWETKMLSTTL